MKKNDVTAALKALKRGEVVLYPTDTLYALGADILNERAVRKVFDIKHRPYSIPLPVAVASMHSMEQLAYLNTTAKKIIKHFLPGTLTIIVKKKPSVPDLVTSGQDNVAIRIPNNTIALQLLAHYGPLTVTSANLHTQQTLGIINDILMQLHTHDIPVCLDDGMHEGTPSTIVDVTTLKLKVIRQGLITEQQLQEAITHG